MPKTVKTPRSDSRLIRRVVLAGALLALLSGCLSDATTSGSQSTLQVASSQPPAPQPAAIIPQDRVAVASFWMHERAEDIATDPAHTNDTWERDFDVQYFGVDEVFDASARIVPAHIFRTSEVGTTVTFSMGPEGALTTYRNEVRAYEVHFDAGDGSLIGRVDLDRGRHEFMPPEPRHAWAGPSLLGMFFRALEGSTMPLAHWGAGTRHAVVEPYVGERPFAGDCEAWSIRQVWDPEPQGGAGGDLPPTLACIEPGGQFPLWVHEGRGEGSYSLQRTSPEFLVPDVDVEPLPTIRSETHAWRPAVSTLPLPFPMLVPPGAPGGTWSRHMSDLVAGVQNDPAYIQYHQASDGPYLKSGTTASDMMHVVGLPVVGQVPFDRMLGPAAGIYASDAQAYYVNTLFKREGTAEQPDVHVAPLPGITLSHGGKEPSASELEPLVEDAVMEAQLAPLLPDWSQVSFMLIMGIPTAQFAEWVLTEPCTSERDGWEATVSASTGSMASVQRLAAGADCMADAGAQASSTVARLAPATTA